LDAWEELAAALRPWVGTLDPLCKANVVLSRIAKRMNGTSTNFHIKEYQNFRISI
jgi:hypothetical protein